jgi:hypothetical protein
MSGEVLIGGDFDIWEELSESVEVALNVSVTAVNLAYRQYSAGCKLGGRHKIHIVVKQFVLPLRLRRYPRIAPQMPKRMHKADITEHLPFIGLQLPVTGLASSTRHTTNP